MNDFLEIPKANIETGTIVFGRGFMHRLVCIGHENGGGEISVPDTKPHVPPATMAKHIQSEQDRLETEVAERVLLSDEVMHLSGCQLVQRV